MLFSADRIQLKDVRITYPMWSIVIWLKQN